MTASPDLLDQRPSTSSCALERAADDLVDRSEVCCPRCGAEGATQLPSFVGPDGAFDRVDFVCGRCATEHPIWVG